MYKISSLKQNRTFLMADASELSHFREMGPKWWDKASGTKGLHSMNKLRVPLVRDGLINMGAVKKELVGTSKPLRDLLILEVGCGGGILTEPLAKLGCTIMGIDLCPELIEQAKQHAALDPSLANLKYSLESAEEHAAKNFQKYDAVVASEVLEHVPDQGVFLENCVKCLKPGGSIFITTINKTAASWLLGIIFAEYVWGILPRGTHHWEKFISPQKTRRILKNCHCTTRTVAGMFYNFLTDAWRCTSIKSINYALHAVKD